MANLTFRSVLASGSRLLGEGQGSTGEDVLDLFLPQFSLSGSKDLPALLILATQRVNFEKNFITLNAPPDVTGQSYDVARDEDYFVGRILSNPSTTWSLQVARVPSGILQAAGNRLGIHTRSTDGEPAGNRDNFGVARLFLVYFGSEGGGPTIGG